MYVFNGVLAAQGYGSMVQQGVTLFDSRVQTSGGHSIRQRQHKSHVMWQLTSWNWRDTKFICVSRAGPTLRCPCIS